MDELKVLLKKIFLISDGDFNKDLTKDDISTWDSLRHMQLITQLENIYSVELSIHEIIAMQSVSDIAKILQKKGVLSE